MCLLDWLMVIPVSKLLSKTNEDENVSILARVFQVIIYLFRDWEKGLPLTHSGVVRDWAENSHRWPCTISLIVSYARKLTAICSQWGAVQGFSLVEKTLRQREERTKQAKRDECVQGYPSHLLTVVFVTCFAWSGVEDGCVKQRTQEKNQTVEHIHHHQWWRSAYQIRTTTGRRQNVKHCTRQPCWDSARQWRRRQYSR